MLATYFSIYNIDNVNKVIEGDVELRIEKFTGFVIFICTCCLGVFLSLSGCVNSDNNSSTNVSAEPPVANGHVYLDGSAVSGAIVEAVSVNGTDRQFTITDDKGTYVLIIMPHTLYNITAMYQGMRHTVWPAYLEDKTDTYDIYLTTTPRSTIEGTGYITGDTQFNPPISCYDININSTKDNTTISKAMNNDGSYSLEVEPNVIYYAIGTIGAMGSPPIAQFYYHNFPTGLGNNPLITVGSNETVLIDIAFVIP